MSDHDLVFIEIVIIWRNAGSGLNVDLAGWNCFGGQEIFFVGFITGNVIDCKIFGLINFVIFDDVEFFEFLELLFCDRGGAGLILIGAIFLRLFAGTHSAIHHNVERIFISDSDVTFTAVRVDLVINEAINAGLNCGIGNNCKGADKNCQNSQKAAQLVAKKISVGVADNV